MTKPQFAVIECERLKKQYHWCSLAEFLPDSKTVVGFINCQVDQPFLIALWDAESGKKLKVIDDIPYSPSSHVWVSPDRRAMAIATSKISVVNEDFLKTGDRVQYKTTGKTYIVDTATLKIRATLPYPVSEAAFSGDGELMAVRDADDKIVRIINLQTNRELAALKACNDASMLAFRHDPAELWIVQDDVVCTWNHHTGKVQKGAKVPGSNHAISPDGRNLVFCCGKYKQYSPVVVDTTSWKSRKINFFGEVRHCSLSPDAIKLAIAADNTLVIWDLVEDCVWLKWKKPHYIGISHATFSPDGQRIACTMNGYVCIFDFRAGAKNHAIEHPKPKAGELQCLRMVGPDDRMDRVDGYLEPLNPLPVICPECKQVDLDYVHSPYVLGKKVESPVDFAPAVAGNLLVRESMKRVLEIAAPESCKFYPTIHRKTKQPTAWWLAVPQHTQTTSEPSANKCQKCGEPHNWNDVMEATANPISKFEVFKAYNSWGPNSHDERNLYFSVRLESLLKKLGLRGMVRSIDCKNVPTPEDLAWVEEKFRLLKQADSKSAGAGKSDTAKDWFKDYLKKNAKKKPVVHDFTAVEKKHGVKLPESYKEFIATVGTKTFKDIDDEEGFCAHVLPPKKLEFEDCCEQGEDEEATFKGVMFATTDHGDAFYFDVCRKAADYEVRKHDHEIGSYEPYAKNFAECIKRFAGA